MELVIASNNKNKIREITQILGNFFDRLYTLQELGIDIEIAETGKTFYDNAYLKAEQISKITKKVAIADDSGLEVYALDGAPGVFSARYANVSCGKNLPCDDEKNNQFLLRNMANITDRRARFVSAIVLYYPDGEAVSAQGVTEGEILHEKIGDKGFGYDSLFFSYDVQKSFGQCSAIEKNSVSHRARALLELKQALTHRK